MDDGDGNVLLSHKRILRLKNWDVVEEKFNNEEIVDALVNEVTKGGLKKLSGLNAFMPASQVSIGYKKDLSVFLDEVLASKIIDFNKEKRRIILSRKVEGTKRTDALKEEVYSKIHVGDVIEGTVQRLTNLEHLLILENGWTNPHFSTFLAKSKTPFRCGSTKSKN